MPLDAAVHAWVASRVGAAPTEVFFEARSLSEVWGVRLDDGRAVAVKRRGGGPRLEAVARAHRAAAAAGVDTPELLAGPDRTLQDAWLTAEQWRPEGEAAPVGDAPIAFARLLARIVAALRDVDPDGVDPPPWLGYTHADRARVWPPPASERWDPHRIEVELPPALVGLARAARARLLASDLPPVLGHADLNGLNVRWVGGHPIVHDWDSIAWVPEAVLVGVLAADHVAGPDAGAIADIPTGARVMAAYEDAVGRSFDAREREVAWAASAWLACYNAAFEHLHGAPGAVTAQIVVDGPERLARAAASVE